MYWFVKCGIAMTMIVCLDNMFVYIPDLFGLNSKITGNNHNVYRYESPSPNFNYQLCVTLAPPSIGQVLTT